MALEELGAYRAEISDTVGRDDFLLKEGFDLIAAYRRIKNDLARASILAMILAVGEAERLAAEKQ